MEQGARSKKSMLSALYSPLFTPCPSSLLHALMYYIDPHIHMVSRTTDDYETLAKMGCVGVSEPAFWAGYDRGSVDGFRDYFEQLTVFEPKRSGWYNIQHFTWLCINAKEAENVALARQVIAMIPEFLKRPGVLGIGEIGLNKNTKNEATVFMNTSIWPPGWTNKSSSTRPTSRTSSRARR